MLNVFGVTALVGAFIISVALWPFGALIALAAVPFGGSLLVVVVAVAVWVYDSSKTSPRIKPEQEPKPLSHHLVSS
jgi:hypothetical protein